MRLRNISFFAICLMMAWGCTDDDSTGMENNIPTIEIADFDEDGYSVVSYEGNRLTLNADIKTGYKPEELKYRWYLIDKQMESNSNTAGSDEEPYERELIGEGAVLSYEVNLKPGNYEVVCEVRAANGYTAYKTAKLKVTTNFSEGFYILKETADGMTDVDVFKSGENRLIPDVVSAVLGAPMQGRPQGLSMAFTHSFVDEATSKRDFTDVVSVATQTGEFVVFRTTDLQPVFTRANLTFEGLDADEKPYGIVSGMWENYFLTDKGVRANYQASISPGTGIYGAASLGGASRFITYDELTMGMLYWSDTAHTLYVSDFNGSCYELGEPAVTGLTAEDCIACGSNSYSMMCNFILQNKDTGERTMFLISAGAVMMSVPLAGTHFERSQLFSTNGPSASVVYGVDGNKIYAYDFMNGVEEEIRAAELPENETISYISDQTFNNKEYFVIGTQTGGDYTLYFYDVLGGKPDGKPVFKVTGKGAVKSMHYTQSGYNTMVSGVPQTMD